MKEGKTYLMMSKPPFAHCFRAIYADSWTVDVSENTNSVTDLFNSNWVTTKVCSVNWLKINWIQIHEYRGRLSLGQLIKETPELLI